MKDISLAMKYSLKLELVSHTSYSHLFLSLLEDIEVVLERLKTKQLIFVVKHQDRNLVLGKSFFYLLFAKVRFMSRFHLATKRVEVFHFKFYYIFERIRA